MWIKSLELRKNVERNDFMELAGCKMNLPFRTGLKHGMVDIWAYFLYNTVIVMRRSAVLYRMKN